MKTKGRSDPREIVRRALARYAEPEVAARLAALPHPSPFLASRGRTLADYAATKLGPDSPDGLNARLRSVYEVDRALDGGTRGELAELTRARSALLEIVRVGGGDPEATLDAPASGCAGVAVSDRRRPGRWGVVLRGIPDTGEVIVRWDDAEDPERLSALAVGGARLRARA